MANPPSDNPEHTDPAPTEWFAAILEPLAALAIQRGIGLPTLVDSLKLALVRAAVSTDAAQGAAGERGQAEASASASRSRLSDSRVALMTGVHRKDLRRLRQIGPAALNRGPSVANQVFARWLAEPRWRGADDEPRDLVRQSDEGARSFESLVHSVTRDVHPRAVLEELLRLQLVQVGEGADGVATVRVIRRAFVPPPGSAQLLDVAQANLADHVAAVCSNLQADGRRFLEQAIYSDELTAESARQFNRETRLAWDQLLAQMMPRLRALYEADQQSDRPRDYRVRLGMYGYAGPDAYRHDDPYQSSQKAPLK